MFTMFAILVECVSMLTFVAQLKLVGMSFVLQAFYHKPKYRAHFLPDDDGKAEDHQRYYISS